MDSYRKMQDYCATCADVTTHVIEDGTTACQSCGHIDYLQQDVDLI